MKQKNVFLVLVAAAVLTVGAVGCESDGDSGNPAVVNEGPDVQLGETGLCANVQCYEDARCDRDTGVCVCNYGYENWNDGVGCTAGELNLCDATNCAAHAYCQADTGNCVCYKGYEDWTDGTGCTRIEQDLCDGVDCFDNASCHADTGECVCDENYENWTDGLGCKPIEQDLCDGVDCFANASCDPDSGDCVCDEDYENWTDAAGCAPQALAILGSFDDGWGGHHEIDDATWTQGGFGNPSFFHVSAFSNVDRYIIAQNNTHNAWSAEGWSRFDWTWFDGGDGLQLWFCQGAYDAETEAEALATPAADDTDPSSGGCAGAAWSALTTADAQLILQGDWVDNFGMDHAIDATSWVQSIEGSPEDTYAFVLSQFSGTEMWLTAQNAADNPTGADQWSRFDWTWFDAGDGIELWYCQNVFEAASEEDALATPRADETDPSSGGCGASSWSKLLPVDVP